MISRKYNSHIVQTLATNLLFLIMFVNVDVALSAWQPPIGIPAPSFGINETVDMYIGQQYTFTDGRGTIDYPISPVSGKPFTHYVDNTHPNSTNTNNPYGTPSKPRRIIPENLVAGSVVEVHGGPYNYILYGWQQKIPFNGSGTQLKPIFIRGINNPKLDIGVSVEGQYLIIEGFEAYGFGIWPRGPFISVQNHHISIRNSDIHRQHGTRGVGVGIGWPHGHSTHPQYLDPTLVEGVVVYNNTIHDYGFLDWLGNYTGDSSKDSMGVYVHHNAFKTWVVDNHIYNIDGDCIHLNAWGIDDNTQFPPTLSYIGRNVMHHARENAFDSKVAYDTITSQNKMYDIRTSSGSDGSALVVQTEHQTSKYPLQERAWHLFNEIYDSDNGIRVQESKNVYLIGNVIHDIISSRSLVNNPYSSGSAIKGWATHDVNILNNVIHNSDHGIMNAGNKQFSEVHMANNIISNLTDNFNSQFGLQPYHVFIDGSWTNTPDRSTASNNLYFQNGNSLAISWGNSIYSSVSTFQAAIGQAQGNIEADPKFVDPASNDFHIQLTSPAIDSGTSSGIVQQVFDTFQNLYGIDIRNDIEGNPRIGVWDIGAYEGSISDPTNPTPILQSIGNKTVDENSSLIFNISATDNDPITYSAIGLPTGATLNSQSGAFAWTPDYTQAGSYSVTFRASDGNSLDSETITITVNNINRAPVLGIISDQSVNENVLLNFTVNATDPDGQTLTYSITGLPNGAVFASQTFTWIPSYSQAGTFAVTFTVDDGQAQDSQAITITVNNVNRAPVFSTINNKSVWSDDPLTFNVSANDPDGDPVTYSANTVPSGATFIAQTFDWTPTPAQIGTYNVTFYASDGQLQDSQLVTITVNVDNMAPTVTNLLPASGAIQVPLNNLITLNITDAGKGIEPQSVKIKVKTNDNPNNTDVYFGDLDHDVSPLGDCRRIGNNNDYKFVFQPTQDLLYYDQTVTVTVNATDLAGNVMNSYIYSFVTEMHLFGQNKLINTNSEDNDKPETVCDSNGNIWAVWHSGSVGNRDIYIGTLTAGANNFGSITQITNDAADQCNPALALDSNDKLYVVWQDDRNGNWDIYLSTSTDGINWSVETMINEPEDGQVNPVSNEVNPAIVIDGQSPNYAHVVWQDDQAGNQDIYIASSNNSYSTTAVPQQITSNISDQVEPAITADSANTIYVVWTDSRNSSSDIYGAASNNGPWTNVALVDNINNQSSPVIATESTGTILHLLWVDDTLGDNDIYYTSSNNGLPGSPVIGSSIIDDTSGADQLEPTIAINGTTSNNDLKVFACWQDWRNADSDLYFTELNSSSGTNVFVNDGGSGAYQSEPAIGIDENGHPYLIWADDRSNNTGIYFTGSTGTEPVALASASVNAAALNDTVVGVNPQAINNLDDVSIVLPSGSCSYDVDVSIVRIANQQTFSVPCLGGYEFGPSGIQFNQPVTITIPYVYSSSIGSTVPYWFNSVTGTLSQQGITNVRDITLSPTLHAISFETTHFTPFYLLGGGSGGIVGALGGGGGGGCSVSAGCEGDIVEFAIPYIMLTVVMAILKKRDARYCELNNI